MTFSDPASSHCKHCGTIVADAIAGGMCPKCLLGVAQSMDQPDEGNFAETIDSGSNHPITRNGASKSAIGKSVGGIGQTLGDYLLDGEIARGGMGVIYKATHQTLGRQVALKLILSGQFASENDVRRFHLEAESAASLDHSGIVPIYEIGQQDGHHYFTMKLIEGGSLAERLPEIRSDLPGSVRLLASVAEAIDYAHKRGILHRDIKPANILLDEEGIPLVTDLGLAKQIQSESDLTGTGAIVGTPAYMSPEQASASKEITTATDVYALGAILYECLTGRPPHQGESAVATLMLAAKGEVALPRSLVKKVDPTLELVCMKCLAASPGERYASAAALSQDLRHWLAGESVSVRPKSFAVICGDLLANQLRSAIGAMMLGVLGGIALGVPAYGSMADRYFHRDKASFNLAKLQEALPDVSIYDPWWLHPPSFMVGPAFLLGFLFCFMLGVLIVRVVKPQNIQQTLAIGLVAGLLMAIVEFGLYGVAGSWNTFGLVNADELENLVIAGFGDEAESRASIRGFFEEYPGLEQLPAEQQTETLSKIVSTKIMLSTPPVALGTLSACLIFAAVFCVFGTLHAYRLLHASFSMPNRVLRYAEVVFLLACAGISATAMMFTLVGMFGDDANRVSLMLEVAVPGIVFVLLSIPGWCHSRWFFRWSAYGMVGVTWFLIG